MKLTKEHLHVTDLIVLKGLQKAGPKTRLQLQTMGFTPAMIDRLEEIGILLKELNNANLNEYKVNEDLFQAQ
jgi:hypothetical protein